MKKFLAVLLILSTTVVFAQTYNYSGSVDKKCAVTNLDNGSLSFADTNSDGFVDKFGGEDTFTYQTNTACQGLLNTSSSLNGATGTAPACLFPDGSNVASVGYTPVPQNSTITFSFQNDGQAPLPAGYYEVNCTLTITM